MTVGLSQKAIVNLRCTAYVHARAAQLHSMHRRRCVGVMRQQSWVVAHNITCPALRGKRGASSR